MHSFKFELITTASLSLTIDSDIGQNYTLVPLRHMLL